MPLYEYQCEPCGHRFEVIQKFSDAPPVCPKCGGPVEKLVSSPAIQFKGSGFYLTDYGRGGKSDTAPGKDGKTESGDKASKGDKGGTSDAAASSTGDSSAGKSTESKSTETKSTESKSSESKPAAPPAAKSD